MERDPKKRIKLEEICQQPWVAQASFQISIVCLKPQQLWPPEDMLNAGALPRNLRMAAAGDCW